MLRKGINKANCFLEAAVFAEGGQKGVIGLLKGGGRWGWCKFVAELQHLLVLIVAKDRPLVFGVTAGLWSYLQRWWYFVYSFLCSSALCGSWWFEAIVHESLGSGLGGGWF